MVNLRSRDLLKILLLAALILLTPERTCAGAGPGSVALETDDPLKTSEEADIENMSFYLKEYFLQQKLEGNRPTYLQYIPDPNDGHLQFLLSLRYPLLPGESIFHALLGNVYLTYDGLFDFYLRTRPSSPVISRLQNPGLMAQYDVGGDLPLQYVTWGYFHESNGQTVDTLEAFNGAGDHAEDRISRGWDYLEGSARFTWLRAIPLSIRLSLSPSVRLFTGYQGLSEDTDEGVFWKPVEDQPHISEYDGLRTTVLIEKAFRPIGELLRFKYWSLGADLRTGYNYGSFCKYWSGKYTLTLWFGGVPLYLSYFDGYGKYISTYSDRGSMFGVGMRMW